MHTASPLLLSDMAIMTGHEKEAAIKMIAIDSFGLKYYCQDEWLREKYGEIIEERNGRKLHVSVDQYNIIQTREFTTCKTQDTSVVDKPIDML